MLIRVPLSQGRPTGGWTVPRSGMVWFFLFIGRFLCFEAGALCSAAGPTNGRLASVTCGRCPGDSPHAVRRSGKLANNFRLAACMAVAACMSVCRRAQPSNSWIVRSPFKYPAPPGNWRRISQGVAYQRYRFCSVPLPPLVYSILYGSRRAPSPSPQSDQRAAGAILIRPISK